MKAFIQAYVIDFLVSLHIQYTRCSYLHHSFPYFLYFSSQYQNLLFLYSPPLIHINQQSRHIMQGEELTMDYYSITTSDVEWRAAICLCGQNACRGSFLHYATQDDLQQVLNSNCGPLWRLVHVIYCFDITLNI